MFWCIEPLHSSSKNYFLLDRHENCHHINDGSRPTTTKDTSQNHIDTTPHDMCDYDQPNFTLYAIYYCPIPTLVIHSHPDIYLPLSTARCHILYSFCSRDA